MKSTEWKSVKAWIWSRVYGIVLQCFITELLRRYPAWRSSLCAQCQWLWLRSRLRHFFLVSRLIKKKKTNYKSISIAKGVYNFYKLYLLIKNNKLPYQSVAHTIWFCKWSEVLKKIYFKENLDNVFFFFFYHKTPALW